MKEGTFIGRIKIFLKMHRREIRFVIAFLLIYLILHGVHYLTREVTAPLLVDKMTATASAKIINTITPSEKIIAVKNVLGSGSHSLFIDAGCDGMDGLLVVTAAVLAFKMGLWWKLAGLGLGSLVVYAVNLLRIILLYYTYKYSPSLFDLMHTYVGQSMVILAGLAFFALWTAQAKKCYAEEA